MLLHSLGHFQEPNWSVSQYYQVALQQHNAAQQIMRMLFGDPDVNFTFLDFACGFGRLLRFLSLSLRRKQIWASEVQGEALNFVVDEFGVHGVRSDFDPQRFDPGRQLQFVWVASLFSHLPRSLFQDWLARLVALLTPCGVLCFSARDQHLLHRDAAMPQEGFLYSGISENDALDSTVYGTTWVSETFVRTLVRDTCGANYSCFRIKRHEQDLYVVSRRVDLGRLESFRLGPWGWVDECRLTNDGELYMRGWAALLTRGL